MSNNQRAKPNSASRPVVKFNYISRVPEGFAEQIKERRSKQCFRNQELNLHRVSRPFFEDLGTQTCSICEMHFFDSGMLTIGNCRHKYCKNCLIQYATYKINVSEEVMCPEEECPEKLSSNSPLYELLSQEIKNRFREQELWRQTINNPNVRLCPRQGCKQGIVDMTVRPPRCRKCRNQFCANCMMIYHPNSSCDDHLMGVLRDFKRCPRCGIMIQKIDGCNHIQCRCRHQFCYVCLSNWQNRHYNCGQIIEGGQYQVEYVYEQPRHQRLYQPRLNEYRVNDERPRRREEYQNPPLTCAQRMCQIIFFIIFLVLGPLGILVYFILRFLFFVIRGIIKSCDYIATNCLGVFVCPCLVVYYGCSDLCATFPRDSTCYIIGIYCDILKETLQKIFRC